MVTKISQFLNTSFSTLSIDDATNSAVSYPGTLIHTTTATPATGIGVGLRFQTETATNNIETGMTIEAVSSDVTAASEDFDFVVRLMQNGAAAAERFRVTSAGAVTLTGALVAGSFRPTSATVPTNGMYLPAANTVAIATNGSDALRLTATNNLLVNSTTTPLGGASTLTLNGPGTNAGGLQLLGGSASGGSNIAGVSSGGMTLSTFTGAVGSEVYTERMRIAADGNIAIGTTTTTTARLTIQGISGANTLGEIYSNDGTQWTRLGSNFSVGAYNNIVSAGDHAIIFSNGTSGTGAFTIAPWATATSGMRIDANGNVSIGLGSVTTGYELDVGGSVRVAGGIVATGEITAYFSDQRLKANITAITNAVDKVMAINGVYYNANDLAVELAGEDKTIQRVGLLAQEVEAVLPHVVKMSPIDIGSDGNSKTGENYKTLQYERIVPLLVEAIKEQQQQIDTLVKRVEQLENKSTT